MSEQILQQPDGRLAVFSRNTNTIIVWDATEDEIVEWRAERAAERAREETREQIRAVGAGDAMRIYGRRAMKWHDAVTADHEHGGEYSAERT